jgi:trimethylamine--corrinoid protein Co-methyltransferase
VPDVRAARESMMSLWPTMLAGANIVVHGAGWLEGSLEASLAKLEEDLPALEELGRVLAAKVDLCDEAFAIDAFRDVGPGGTFLGAAHTLRHLREAASAQAAVPGWKELQDRFEPLPLEPAIDEELVSFVERRKAELGPS